MKGIRKTSKYIYVPVGFIRAIDIDRALTKDCHDRQKYLERLGDRIKKETEVKLTLETKKKKEFIQFSWE